MVIESSLLTFLNTMLNKTKLTPRVKYFSFEEKYFKWPVPATYIISF